MGNVRLIQIIFHLCIATAFHSDAAVEPLNLDMKGCRHE